MNQEMSADTSARTNAPRRKAGRHFLQVPGPSNVPDRILRAIDKPVIDHRGPEFQALAKSVLAGLKDVFRCSGPVVMYPASGTGAWEAALANTMSPGDRLLMFETGHFATLWRDLAIKMGLEVEFVPGDWRHPIDSAVVEERLAADRGHAIKAVCAVHNETSTGVVSDIARIRRAIDAAKHPALLFVDAVSSLASLDYRHDEWGVDIAVSSSQKGLMLPPGLGFNAIGEKALAAHRTAKLPRAFWDWSAMLAANANGFFPYTPNTNLLFGLNEALIMIAEEGLDRVVVRHARHGAATRAAVRAWGLPFQCANEGAFSDTLTAVAMPDGVNADTVRLAILENFDLSLGQGLGKVAGKLFRIGHLGDFNDLMLMGTLAGVEMGLALAKVPHKKGGAQAAMDHLTRTAGAA
jgi:alanine-glyoxylate transaminase/serine-glyoxylate transaminase/serine-pyruvate transaminase